MPDLINLRVASDLAEPAHPDDVRRLRAILNMRGYDADPCDIERAYSEWSRETVGIEWRPMSPATPPDGLFHAVMTEMAEGPARKPPAQADLTERQAEVLRFVLERIAATGSMPRNQDVADRFGHATRSTASIILDSIRRAGYPLPRNATGRPPARLTRKQRLALKEAVDARS